MYIGKGLIVFRIMKFCNWIHSWKSLPDDDLSSSKMCLDASE